MIETRATVVAVHGEFAEVATQRHSACGSCNVKAGCGTSLLDEWFARRRQVIRLANRVGARAGDDVIVGLDESTLQRSALLLYGVPLLGLLMGGVFGEFFFSFAPGSELGAILGGLSGLTAALLLVNVMTRVDVKNGSSDIRLLRVVSRTQTLSPRVELAAYEAEGFRKSE